MFSLFKKPKAEPVKAEPIKPTNYTKVMESYRAGLVLGMRNRVTSIHPYKPPKGVVPDDKIDQIMAQDSVPYDWANSASYQADFMFRGYQYLANLATRPEIRKIVSIIAEEMTRKWIVFKAQGDDDKLADKIVEIEKEFTRLKVREAFRKAFEDDGYFGRSHIYFDVEKPKGGRAYDDPDELKTPLPFTKAKIGKGALKGLRNVEAMWTYPGLYNSNNPLHPDFYKPSTWFVFQKDVHRNRLITITSNPVPDMLKPSFAFGGIPLAQLVEPYVNNWISTRDSVKDMVHSYSTSGIKTNLETTLQGGSGTNLFDRVDLFVELRDNKGMLVLDKNEEFFQFNAPLSGLDSLQSQAQEHMASISSIPIVKLLTNTPSGLNASSDGEIRVFYDFIHSRQEADARDPITQALNFVQLSLFGEIDENISFDFVPLYQLSELEQSQVEINQATADEKYITMNALDPEEVRQTISANKDSRYDGLDMGVNYDSENGEGEEGEAESSADKSAT